MVGRAADVAAVREMLLRGDVRLVGATEPQHWPAWAAAERAEYDHSVAAIHVQLDEATFAAAWAAGRAMTLEQALAEALA